MKRNFNDAVMELMRKGVDPLAALAKVEESGEFDEEEVAEWFRKFNNRKKKNIRENRS